MARPTNTEKKATIMTPEVKTNRSPNFSTNFPEINPDAKRVNANIETISPIAALLTPKVRAKIGIAGRSTPKPTATENAAAVTMKTSRGRSPKSRLRINQGPRRMILLGLRRNPYWCAVELHAT